MTRNPRRHALSVPVRSGSEVGFPQSLGEVHDMLYDKSLGKDVTIYSNKETVIDDRRRISFSAPDGSIWHVKAPGESRKIGTATYKVKSIDFDKGNAVIEMIPDNADIEPQTMNLSAAGVTPVK